MALEKKLKELGFSDKEAKVYLASLELGPSPVQEISKKAGVNRATTYVMIESLTKRGMMSSFEKGKKRFFTAEHPDRLYNVLKSRQRELKEKEDIISNIMPDLLAINAASENQPRVRFFEGVEGAHAIQQDIIDSRPEVIEHAIDLDEYRKHFRDEDFPEHREKMKKHTIKALVTTAGEPPARWRQGGYYEDYKYVDKDKFIFPGELIIYANKVAMITYKGAMVGVIIENAEVRQMVSTIFNMAWESVTKK